MQLAMANVYVIIQYRGRKHTLESKTRSHASVFQLPQLLKDTFAHFEPVTSDLPSVVEHKAKLA